ncbi:AAC(3)-I family aminoglycoside N-acetyltransferase [Methylobacterium nonmethylotrophicum]|uniref:AAC(3)-I family aminoglycoside N-acetyltransferase n=1 Tax=Methylobacterium nonmethylotrophicum TaxID=1141884 RepID=A0A4Z0NUJ6_9HYPH|nr:AAC(3)-I family aminoglycoside N-acetyltransferase [Methylobacterium nonmethylotrophicum]TGE01175.1 AAC(3)-I family aminoglycoside N-acetyltransferase [Methylobacterium nonmethylotrophicum]
MVATPPLTIRRLGPADIALMRDLNALFGEVFDDPVTYGDAKPDDAYLAALLGREHVAVLVALAGGTVVGGLTAYALDKAERARREIYLYDLAVAADHRRRGIATSLIAHLRAVAAESGTWVIFVQADPDDAPALALYGKLGLREDVHHFDIPVPPRG